AGCPSCVGAPVLPHSGDDPEVSARGRVPDKDAALILMHQLLEKEPYIPKTPKRGWEGAPAGAFGPDPEAEAEAERIPARRRKVKPLPPEVERRLRLSMGRLPNKRET
ncbi:hypothetical protein ACFL6M_05325, partial [Candidatus Eisenbacteria bacterium]